MTDDLTYIYDYKTNDAILGQIRVIEDIIGVLPARWFRLLLKKQLNRADRFQIGCFMYVNGLHPGIFFELRQICGDKQIHPEKYNTLFSQFNRDPLIRNRYYSYNISNARYEHLNGRVCSLYLQN